MPIARSRRLPVSVPGALIDPHGAGLKPERYVGEGPHRAVGEADVADVDEGFQAVHGSGVRLPSDARVLSPTVAPGQPFMRPETSSGAKSEPRTLNLELLPARLFRQQFFQQLRQQRRVVGLHQVGDARGRHLEFFQCR